jgi:hypothetical protein
MPFGPTTSTGANVSASATAVTVFAASTNAVEGRTVFNDSTALLYLKKGSGASTTDHFTQVQPGQYFEFPQPVYRGLVSGIWAAANGAARTSEDS